MTAEPIGLEPAEQVLWTGAPQRAPLFESVDRIVLPAQAVVVAAGVVFGVVNADRPYAIAYWLFVAVGVLVVPARMIARRLTTRGSRYTVTDRRLIVRTRNREFASDLRDLPPPVVYPHRDGTGTIEFRSGRTVAVQPDDKRSPTGNRFTLWGILDAQRVRDIIATARESTTG
jgi:hypothetical protein